MKSRTKSTALLAPMVLGILAAGCAAPHSEVPLATSFPTTEQPKLQAAAHWSVIANDVARHLSRDVGNTRPLAVRAPETGSPFEHAFARQLASALVAEGLTVQNVPDGALDVVFETQTVEFAPGRSQGRHHGALTLLAGGLWALAAVDATAAGVATAAVVAEDARGTLSSGYAHGDTPATEILITVHVSDEARYLAHRSFIYYTADRDRTLYRPGNGMHAIELRGER